MDLHDVAAEVVDPMVDCWIDWCSDLLLTWIDELASTISASEHFVSRCVWRSVVSSADQFTFYFIAYDLLILKHMGSKMLPAHVVSSVDQFCIISDSAGCMHANLYVLSSPAVHRVVCMGKPSDAEGSVGRGKQEGLAGRALS
jgi:hypothetical protein